MSDVVQIVAAVGSVLAAGVAAFVVFAFVVFAFDKAAA